MHLPFTADQAFAAGLSVFAMVAFAGFVGVGFRAIQWGLAKDANAFGALAIIASICGGLGLILAAMAINVLAPR